MLRALLIFLVIYLIVRLVQSYTRENPNKHNHAYRNQNSDRKEGEITVESFTSNNKKVSKNDGEYVNYEEL